MNISHLYENQFDSKYNFDERNQISKTLVIASTPRCGSHLLGHSLYETNTFGFPLEYANPVNLKKWSLIFDETDFNELLTKIESVRTSGNGVFSIKAHYSHLAGFGGMRGLLDRYRKPYFVLLTRSDSLKQAISLSIARQSGVWIQGQTAKSNKITYDFEDIRYCLKRTILQNASWKYQLASHNCNYIEIDFDIVKKDLPSAIKLISNFIQLEVSDDMIPIMPPTVKQSGIINKEWMERFIFESSNQGVDELLDVDYMLAKKSKLKKIKNILFNER